MTLQNIIENNNKQAFLEQPISVKITPDIAKMIQYISIQTTLNTSSIVRYGICELFKKISNTKHDTDNL